MVLPKNLHVPLGGSSCLTPCHIGALLWKEGVWNASMRRPRSVHKSVRSILHREIIGTGRIEAHWGEFYDEIYAGRKEVDYEPLAVYEREEVGMLMEQADQFIKRIESLIA